MLIIGCNVRQRVYKLNFKINEERRKRIGNFVNILRDYKELSKKYIIFSTYVAFVCSFPLYLDKTKKEIESRDVVQVSFEVSLHIFIIPFVCYSIIFVHVCVRNFISYSTYITVIFCLLSSFCYVMDGRNKSR